MTKTTNMFSTMKRIMTKNFCFALQSIIIPKNPYMENRKSKKDRPITKYGCMTTNYIFFQKNTMEAKFCHVLHKTTSLLSCTIWQLMISYFDSLGGSKKYIIISTTSCKQRRLSFFCPKIVNMLSCTIYGG